MTRKWQSFRFKGKKIKLRVNTSYNEIVEIWMRKLTCHYIPCHDIIMFPTRIDRKNMFVFQIIVSLCMILLNTLY
jgi:hypothetical protein